MAKLFLLGRNGGLYPTDRVSADAIAKLSGKDVECEVKQSRNLKHHQKYWCLVNLCAENTERFTAKRIHEIFKMRTGYATTYTLADGTKMVDYDSIAWAKMDQTAFEAFYERVLDVVAKDILPGVNRADLQRELMEYLK